MFCVFWSPEATLLPQGTALHCYFQNYNLNFNDKLAPGTSVEVPVVPVVPVENGAAKSTMIKLLVGEIEPQTGTVWKLSWASMSMKKKSQVGNTHHRERWNASNRNTGGGTGIGQDGNYIRGHGAHDS